MSKIFVKSSSGTMSLSDTRIYNPRSESSYMFRNNDEDETTYTGNEDGAYRDEMTEKKKKKRDDRKKEMSKLKHIKVKPSDIESISDDDEQEEDEKLNREVEPSKLTGPPGNMGFLTSLANQAKGPGAAGGHAFATGEPMEISSQLLKGRGRRQRNPQHTLPTGDYSPKSIHSFIKNPDNRNKLLGHDVRFTDHADARAVSRNLYHHSEGKVRNKKPGAVYTNHEKDVFSSAKGLSKYPNMMNYLSDLARVFVAQHGIEPQDQPGINIHFADRGQDPSRDFTHSEHGTNNLGGYVINLVRDVDNPDGHAISSIMGDTTPGGVRKDTLEPFEPHEGRTYSVMDDEIGYHEKYQSPELDQYFDIAERQTPPDEHNYHDIPNEALDFLKTHFNENLSGQHGRKLLSFPKTKGLGHRVNYAAPNPKNNWNAPNEVSKLPNVVHDLHTVASAVNTLQENVQLGMTPEQVESLGQDMFTAMHQKYPDAGRFYMHQDKLMNTPGYEASLYDNNGQFIHKSLDAMDLVMNVLKAKGHDERQGFIGTPKKEKPKKTKEDKKVAIRAKKDKKERSKKWRPSTGQFKMPPGGMTPQSATARRAKARMRGIKGAKKTGLGRAHLAVEMSHRGVKTKQPQSKDPKKYRQYMGQQEGRKRLGGVRTVSSQPARFGTRSYRAGPTGAGMLQSRGAMVRRPALKPHRAPPLVPPRTPHAPSMPQLPMPSPPPISQPSRGVAVQGMAAQGPMFNPSRVPTSSVQGVMTGPIGEGSELQKKRLSYYDIAELRQLVNDARRALKRKESKKKGKGTGDTSGAGSNLPRHSENGPVTSTKPEGATEDETDARRFGINPLDLYTSRGGRTP